MALFYLSLIYHTALHYRTHLNSNILMYTSPYCSNKLLYTAIHCILRKLSLPGLPSLQLDVIYCHCHFTECAITYKMPTKLYLMCLKFHRTIEFAYLATKYTIHCQYIDFILTKTSYTAIIHTI